MKSIVYQNYINFIMGNANSSVLPSNNVLLVGKTAIITGANTGIGKEAAKDLYKRGAKVILACRNFEKATKAKDEIIQECENLHNGSIVIKDFDLNSLASVRNCAENILETEEQIHLLINNAGLIGSEFTPRTTEDGFELHFGVNHLGHFLFTLLLLPRIIQSGTARIVNVASVAHKLWAEPMNFDDLDFKKREYTARKAYGQSKLANILFTRELAKRLTERKINNVTTYSLHPGIIITDIWRNVNPCIRYVLYLVIKLRWQSVEDGGRAIIYCAVDENCSKESGLYYSNCKVKKPEPYAEDDDAAKKLWEISLEMVGLNSDYDPFKIHNSVTAN